jgi:hypothetical protein
VAPPLATVQNLNLHQPMTSHLESRSHASVTSPIKQGGSHQMRTVFLTFCLTFCGCRSVVQANKALKINANLVRPIDFSATRFFHEVLC